MDEFKTFMDWAVPRGMDPRLTPYWPDKSKSVKPWGQYGDADDLPRLFDHGFLVPRVSTLDIPGVGDDGEGVKASNNDISGLLETLAHAGRIRREDGPRGANVWKA